MNDRFKYFSNEIEQIKDKNKSGFEFLNTAEMISTNKKLDK